MGNVPVAVRGRQIRTGGSIPLNQNDFNVPYQSLYSNWTNLLKELIIWIGLKSWCKICLDEQPTYIYNIIIHICHSWISCSRPRPTNFGMGTVSTTTPLWMVNAGSLSQCWSAIKTHILLYRWASTSKTFYGGSPGLLGWEVIPDYIVGCSRYLSLELSGC